MKHLNVLKSIATFAAIAFSAQLIPTAALADCPDLSSKKGNQTCTTSCTCVDEDGSCGCCATRCTENVQPAAPVSGDPEPKDKRSKGNPVNMLLGLAVAALAVYLVYSLAKNRNDVNNNLSSKKDIEPRGFGFTF
jgi:hypothetical protein